MLTIRDILQPENVSYTDNVWTWAVAHMMHNGEDWQITTITDTAPIEIVFLSKGEPLSDYLLSGNTTQPGTPTPRDPVDVVGCGVRTENLFDGNYINAYIDVGQYKFVNVGTDAFSAVIEVEPNTTYTVKKYDTSNRFLIGSATRVPTLNMVLSMINIDNEKTEVTFTTGSSTKYIVVYVSTGAEHATQRLMFNKGGTALPYEPYGYKLPPTVNGATYPIYLGQVPTTRKIRKLVLTGDEDWSINSNKAVFVLTDITQGYYDQIQGIICSHLIQYEFYIIFERRVEYGIAFGVRDADRICIRMADYENDIPAFKQWLAAQYAAGTPVTVWYVMSEPETGIVNEPLHKISDYADTISMEQAGVTIPTVAGANTLTIDLNVQPSSMSITGKIREAADV